jgi:hypothetical protein
MEATIFQDTMQAYADGRDGLEPWFVKLPV